ncbi:GNAT family N-acetyltransferase [Bacillus timonensis]|nr:GNAT family N-acetyltransferase [Bacillus timonensis]
MLTTEQLKQIKQLQDECEQFENLNLKLNWDLLTSRKQNEKNDFFHIKNNRIIGFLGLYGFGPKIELCGMVHPVYRRSGIMTDLLKKGLEEVINRGCKKILLNTPANSQSGLGFIRNTDSIYSFSEHQMKWKEIELSNDNKMVTIRKAQTKDKEQISLIDVECFGFSYEEAIAFNAELPTNYSQDTYILEFNGLPVGKIRVQRNNNESWIYGFGVLKDYQGRGIGRSALIQTVQNEVNIGNSVFLEVAASNDNALKLYESCGFARYYTQEYYEILLKN